MAQASFNKSNMSTSSQSSTLSQIAKKLIEETGVNPDQTGSYEPSSQAHTSSKAPRATQLDVISEKKKMNFMRKVVGVCHCMLDSCEKCSSVSTASTSLGDGKILAKSSIKHEKMQEEDLTKSEQAHELRDNVDAAKVAEEREAKKERSAQRKAILDDMTNEYAMRERWFLGNVDNNERECRSKMLIINIPIFRGQSQTRSLQLRHCPDARCSKTNRGLQ